MTMNLRNKYNMTLRVQVDADKDGDYDDPTTEDLSAWVMRANWFLGCRAPYQHMADESRATIVLRNENERFSPQFGTGQMRAVPVHSSLRISARLGSSETYVTLWTGWVESLEIDPALYGAQTCVVQCVGLKSFWQRQRIVMPLLLNVTPKAALEQIMSRAQVPAAVRGGWTLQVTGASTLEVNTYLRDTSAAYDFSTGLQTLPYVGDFLGKDATVWDAISGVVTSDYGRFWINREGKAIFRDRHWLVDPPLLLGGGVQFRQAGRPRHTFAENMKNDVTVSFALRQVSAGNAEILWQMDKPTKIRSSQPKRFTARYTGAAGEQVSGLNVVQPSGADLVADGPVSVTYFEANAQSAEVEISTSAAAVDLQTLVIRGRKVTTTNTQRVNKADQAWAAEFGRRELDITLPFVEDARFAQNVAEYEVLQRGPQQAAEVDTIVLYPLENEQHNRIVRTLELYSIVRMTEDYVNLDLNCHIVGEDHSWEAGGQTWEVTCTLERGVTYAGFQLNTAIGRSQLNDASCRLRL